MAALNFPTSPTLNQVYTANGKSWRWDGTSWKSNNIIGTVNTAPQYQVAYYAASGTTISGSSNLQITGSGVTVAFSTASSSIYNGAFTVIGGAGIGQTLNVGGSVNLWNGSYYTGFRSNSSATAATTYTLPLSTPAIGTSVLSSDISGILSWVPMTATGGVLNGSQFAIPYYPSSGVAITGSSSFTNVGTGISVLYTANSTSASTGSLVVSGGLGVSRDVFIGGSVVGGYWAGNLISTTYGGTGFNSYSKGDLLVGFGNTLSKLPVGNDLTILTASSAAGTGLSWKGLLAPTYGAFGSTSIQTVLGANTETLVNYNLTYEANNVTIGSGTTTRVYINDSGVFNVQFSAQISIASGTQPKSIDMWFKVSGVAVPRSNTRQTITGKDQETVLALNYVSTFISGQYIELAYSSPDANIQLGSFTGLVSPTRPDIPSMILTVTPVSSILPGSGLAITGLASLNLLTSNAQTMVPGTSGVDFAINSLGSVHTFNIPDASTTARGLITTGSQTLLGSKTFASGVAITATTGSVSTITGALTVSGGVGIGGSLYTLSTVNSSISGVNFINGVVASGSWAGSVVTAFYGGTGIQAGSFTTGSLLFANSLTTWSNLNPGTNGYFLISAGTANTPVYTNPATLLVGSATTATYSHQAGYGITAGSANAWTTPRTLNLSGDLSGSVVWSGSGDTTLTATIVANAVALGTDTTGQYASTIAISGSGISATAANADDGTAYTIYSSATNNNTASTIVFRDGSGNFSAGIITANLTGTASTATYAHQSGYAITSGSSSTATTATYSHQAGYAITSGSSSTATTATYSHQAGYAITSGSSSTATTATYSHQAGYAITAGTSALATTASNINVNAGSNNIYNPILFTPQGTGSGVALSSYPSFTFNPTANILNVSGLAVTATTASTSTSSGSLVVTGGVGIGGSVNIGSDVIINGGKESNSTSTGSLIVRGGVGITGGLYVKPFSLSTKGLVVQANTSQSGNLFELQSPASSTLTSFNSNGELNITSTTGSTSTSTGALIVSGGVGIGGSLYTLSSVNSSISGVNHLNGVITSGSWSATAITAFYGGTGLQSTFVVGDLLYANTTTTWSRLAASSNTGYILASAGTGATPVYTNPATISVGLATTATNVNVNNATANSAHFLRISPLATGSGLATSSNTTLSYNPSTFILSTPGLAVTAATNTTSSSSGALIVTGGVGIGSSLIIGGSVGVGTNLLTSTVNITGSANILGSTVITAPDVTNKALRVLGFSSSTQGDIFSLEHPAGGSFTMNGNFAGQAGGRFTIIASGNSQVRGSTFVIQASDTKVVMGVDATSGGGIVYLSNGTNIQLYNSTNAQYAGFKYTGSATTTYTLPASAPGAGVSVLQSDTSGVMTWVPMAAAGGGSGTVTTLTAGTGITFSTGTTITTTGTIRAKRPMTVSFCAGYTPAASGADSVVIRLPDSPSDGVSSITYKPQEFHVRVETASATASTIQLEKYTGVGAFSGTAITSISLIGSTIYENQTSFFAAAGSLLTSGDKLRINFTTLSASHANFSVYLELEEV